jgi:hypothetical protein
MKTGSAPNTTWMVKKYETENRPCGGAIGEWLPGF